MKRFYLLIFSCLLTLEVVAQSGQVRGRVQAVGQPVPFASVGVKGTTVGATAMEDGVFILALPPAAHHLAISALGYAATERAVSVTAA